MNRTVVIRIHPDIQLAEDEYDLETGETGDTMTRTVTEMPRTEGRMVGRGSNLQQISRDSGAMSATAMQILASEPKPCPSDLVERARVFATAAHGAIGQTRKNTGEAYINHPARVVQQLRNVPHTDEMLAAAWLHDVVEDTEVTLYHIQAEFGLAVARLVNDLTDKFPATNIPGDPLNRSVRKQMEAERLAKTNAIVQTIKMADIIDNTRDIKFFPEDFAKIYLKEKIKLVTLLTKAHSSLTDKAYQQISAAVYALYEGQVPTIEAAGYVS